MKFRFVVAFFSLVILVTFVGIFSLLEDGIVSEVSSATGIAIPFPTKLLGAASATDGGELWKPKVPRADVSGDGFEVSAVSALSYDLTTDRLLYEKDIERRLPLASLTKIMTAVVALENAQLDTSMQVDEDALVGENSMGLSAGEKLSMEELLYGLILVSGNDAAEVLAQNSQFGRENFIYMMNKKAEGLGLFNTRFTNPSGLEGDGEQYSTAYDLLVMTQYALQNPTFAKVASTVEHTIPASDTNRQYSLYNETNLLTSYPGVKGVKTGYTYEAGMCLVTYLEYKGHKIVGVILNSSNRRQEMKDLLDYSLRRLDVEPPKHS